MIVTTNISNGMVWLAERTIIYVKQASGAVLLLDANDEELAAYQPTSADEAVIDVTDYMRAYPASKKLYVRDDESQVEVTYSVVGRINPDNVIIPDSVERLWTIAPPSRILADIGTPIILEAYGYDENDDCVTELGNPFIPRRSIDLLVGTRYFAYNRNVDFARKIIFVQHDCGKRYAAVRWESFSGVTRSHTFEVRGVNTATSGTITLLTADGSIDERKGRSDGFTLHLDALNAYDLWYYSDVIHSSRVEVSLDGVTWRTVQVKSSSQTMPDGDAELNRLEIDVTYREYDAY